MHLQTTKRCIREAGLFARTNLLAEQRADGCNTLLLCSIARAVARQDLHLARCLMRNHDLAAVHLRLSFSQVHLVKPLAFASAYETARQQRLAPRFADVSPWRCFDSPSPAVARHAARCLERKRKVLDPLRQEDPLGGHPPYGHCC